MFAKDQVAKAQNKKVQEVDHICSLKITGLCDYKALKEWNIQTVKVWGVFKLLDADKKGRLNGQQILAGLNKLGYQVNEQELRAFLKDILRKETSQKALAEITVTKLEWRIYVHALYIENAQNSNPVIRKLVNLAPDDITKLMNYVKRLEKIMTAAEKTETLILFDAEQTYVQDAIDSYTELVQFKYNKRLPLAVNTFQNYLKAAKERIDYEIEKHAYLKNIIGVKMVRGAYMTEEREIAKKGGFDSPICNTKEDTDEMMDYNCIRMLKIIKDPSKLLIGTHNESTVEKTMVLMQSLGIQKDQVIFS